VNSYVWIGGESYKVLDSNCNFKRRSRSKSSRTNRF